VQFFAKFPLELFQRVFFRSTTRRSARAVLAVIRCACVCACVSVGPAWPHHGLDPETRSLTYIWRLAGREFSPFTTLIRHPLTNSLRFIKNIDRMRPTGQSHIGALTLFVLMHIALAQLLINRGRDDRMHITLNVTYCW